MSAAEDGLEFRAADPEPGTEPRRRGLGQLLLVGRCGVSGLAGIDVRHPDLGVGRGDGARSGAAAGRRCGTRRRAGAEGEDGDEPGTHGDERSVMTGKGHGIPLAGSA